MRIISRYLTKELLFVSLTGFFVFTFLLIMNSLFVMSDLVIKYSMDVFTVIMMLLYLIPSTVAVTVPMAFLVGVLLTYSRLVQDNEYHGMQSGGISITAIAMPAVWLSVLITVAMIAFNNWVLPAANLSYKKLYYEIARKRSAILIQEHSFVKQFDGYLFYVGEKDSKNDVLKKILVFVKDPKNLSEPVRVMTASSGELISDESSLRIALHLHSGSILSTSYSDPFRVNLMNFDSNLIDLDVKGSLRHGYDPSELKGSREMTIDELIKEINSKDSRQDRNWLKVELNKKFSLPFAVLAFCIIGIPLGLMTKKGGRMLGIGFSLVLIFIYYVLLSMGQTYGYSGKMSYFLSAWLPNLFMLAAGAILFAMLIRAKIKRAQR